MINIVYEITGTFGQVQVNYDLNSFSEGIDAINHLPRQFLDSSVLVKSEMKS